MRVLITGGAGFIGSHVADLLLANGYSVRLLDNLDPQVHTAGTAPDYLNPDAELVVGDVRDADAVERALRNVDAVVHLAAAVGVGQSMYEIKSYTQVNELGTAVLLEALARRPVAKLVCASSMSIYGEGLARRQNGEVVNPDERSLEQLRRGIWELQDEDGADLQPLPTPESKRPSLSSVYALNKYAQERLCLIVGKAYGIPTIALRFFNVYGPRQALSNPYTGVLAIFAARLLNGRPPLVFEDGRQRRDFVHVRDVARACLLALESRTASGGVFNVASGISRSILSIADDLAAVMGRSSITPHVTGKYRAGDIRHCFADIRESRTSLGFVPEVAFKQGLEELAAWLADQVAVDRAEHATAELESRGLVA
ncbi:MAG TPA: SDR family NAD(P)-dependent oxidoreductase [Xanthobacteraceae bacterium]|jgi:dTDP-L-rhamnose 4-epimerase|nr:SDR family NAD(P)-dependent oxidoreductase [Xanthobacteraceae bacterium]